MVIVREATKADLNEIAQVHCQAMQETYHDLFSDQYLKSLDPDQFMHMPEECAERTYIAINRDKIVGFVSFCEEDDQKLGHIGEITAMYILKEYQGLGIGRYLIQHCFVDLYGIKNIYIWTLSQNIKSIQFYHHFGFIEDGGKKDLTLQKGKSFPLSRMRKRISLYRA